MKTLLFCLFLMIPLHASALHHPKALRAVIAVDTQAPRIQGSIAADLDHIEKSLYVIAQHLHLTPQIQVIKDQNCTVDSIKSAVLALKDYDNDILFFVYSGHGNMDPYKSSWPVMYPTGGGDFKSGLRASSIVKFFEKNEHRLTILLFDCCNKFISDGPYESVPRSSVSALTAKEHLPGLKKLFLRSKGLIVGSGASHGESSECANWGPEVGGVFLNGFLVSLKEKCGDKEVSWDSILRAIEKYCPQHSRRKSQHPILRYER